jgi:hypothetical protein
MEDFMTSLRVLRRVVLAFLGAAAILSAMVVGVLAYPVPLYAYHVEAGRLGIYSDRPFDAERGRAVLADVERRLRGAPEALRDDASAYRIFVTNDDWRRRLVFLWNSRAAGVNYYPIAGNVFIKRSDIDADRVLHGDGTPVEPPRTLAYYASHEIGHSLIGRHIGARANWRLPAWIREGVADYIGFAGEVDVEALGRAWRAGDPVLDPKRSGQYALYRMLVAFLLVHEGWSVDRLLASEMKLADAERMLEAGPSR